MKVQPIYNNKILKKGLEFAADNSALFIAGTSLALSAVVRPLSILAAPQTDKENKKLACAKSVSSSLIGYLLMLGISLPVARGVKRIDKSPARFLKPETLNALKENGKSLQNSKAYQLSTQIFKLGLGFVIAAPKAFLTSALIPPVMSHLFNVRERLAIRNVSESFEWRIRQRSYARPAVQRGGSSGELLLTNKKKENNVTSNAAQVSFGSSAGIKLSQTMGKVLDNSRVQNFANRFKDSNFVMHAMAVTDIFATGASIYHINKNKNIDESRKKVLNYNSAISTGLCIAGGYVVDKALENPTVRFIKNFSAANKNSPKLGKYVEGIKIVKPALIMGAIYYGIIPFISTFLADKFDAKAQDKET